MLGQGSGTAATIHTCLVGLRKLSQELLRLGRVGGQGLLRCLALIACSPFFLHLSPDALDYPAEPR